MSRRVSPAAGRIQDSPLLDDHEVTMPGFGKTLIVIGLIIAAVGVVLTLAGRIPWIGRLPGDIYIKKENFTFYFPLATSIIISILLTLILWLFRK